MLRGRHIIRVRLATAAIASLGLAPGAPDPRGTARDRDRLCGERAFGYGDTDRHRDQQSRTPHQGGPQP